MMEGSKVEIFPSSLTLPRKSEKSQFVLVNIPHETGIVSVLGEEGERVGVGGGKGREGDVYYWPPSQVTRQRCLACITSVV